MSIERVEPTQVVAAKVRHFRKAVPEAHRGSLDTRLVWLWNQRFGTIQTIYNESADVLDHTACTLILQAIMGADLTSIEQLLTRLEGGAVTDQTIVDQVSMTM